MHAWRTAVQKRSRRFATAHLHHHSTSASWQSVAEAASAISGQLAATPLLESLALNKLVGGRVLVKAESLQRGGSFKIRGALNRLRVLNAEQRDRGVVAFSSGNFAQGLALAAKELGVQATLVMPHDAPLPKVERTRDYGAKVVFSTPSVEGENREVAAARLARQLSEEQGFTLLHPFDDYDIIAGQGTTAWEIALESKRRGISEIDSLLVCCGGGGLVSGCSLAMKHHYPGCEVVPVEPHSYDGARRSLAERRLVSAPGDAATACDSLQAPSPGEKPFSILQQTCARGIAVDEQAVTRAMAVAFDTLKLVLEPGGAVALAAVLAGQVEGAGRVTAVVASGGNVAWPKFQSLVSDGFA